MTLWERINRDPRYLEGKHRIQSRYGLPLDFDVWFDHQKWLEWMEAEEKSAGGPVKRGQAFLEDVYALFRKFQVPDTWHADFMQDIAGLSFERIYSKVKPSRDQDGNWRWEYTATPETDVTDPATGEWTPSQQREFAEAPPQRARENENQDKLDWHPVYQWYKEHPLSTIEQIAKSIGQDPEIVRQCFMEIELEKRDRIGMPSKRRLGVAARVWRLWKTLRKGRRRG
jgi:hypothetical protein